MTKPQKNVTRVIVVVGDADAVDAILARSWLPEANTRQAVVGAEVKCISRVDKVEEV